MGVIDRWLALYAIADEEWREFLMITDLLAIPFFSRGRDEFGRVVRMTAHGYDHYLVSAQSSGWTSAELLAWEAFQYGISLDDWHPESDDH